MFNITVIYINWTCMHAKYSPSNKDGIKLYQHKMSINSKNMLNISKETVSLHLQNIFILGIKIQKRNYKLDMSVARQRLKSARLLSRYIHPPYHGYMGQYHGHKWMTHIFFVPCQSAVPFLR